MKGKIPIFKCPECRRHTMFLYNKDGNYPKTIDEIDQIVCANCDLIANDKHYQ